MPTASYPWLFIYFWTRLSKNNIFAELHELHYMEHFRPGGSKSFFALEENTNRPLYPREKDALAHVWAQCVFKEQSSILFYYHSVDNNRDLKLFRIVSYEGLRHLDQNKKLCRR